MILGINKSSNLLVDWKLVIIEANDFNNAFSPKFPQLYKGRI